MTRLISSGGSDHRGAMRHESLTATHTDPDQDSTWMIGYLDIMTLLVALMVLLFTITYAGDRDDDATAVSDTLQPMAIPLPDELQRAMAAHQPQVPLPAGRLSPLALSAALGVAGLPRRAARVPVTPALLALQAAEPERQVSTAYVAPPAPLAMLSQQPELTQASSAEGLRLPQPLLPDDDELPAGPADFMLVLTDRPPARVREVAPEAIAGSLALQQALEERLETSPYLPDLEGVAVSRVAEGIKLRVEDQWLFPTAEAELTEDGQALVQRLVDVIQRHDGEVAVEGHTDSRSIQTPEFPSNWVLSSARAIAIVHALEQAGVSAQRLRAVGLADTRPLAANDSAEGRAQNRRVEVIIHSR
ncbi:OmpA family protein [Halomonas sp. M5N1S17]|uniref:OmpA family protein n=1 Tax=Halomonas alkalisoli TaxID=2907158 RepID=UPI001F3C7AA2|nr:OmpA family protein [Halomonas alkalisoli]MCE9664994.1 OmpA family protein [Halomonas alkalisoli]